MRDKGDPVKRVVAFNVFFSPSLPLWEIERLIYYFDVVIGRRVLYENSIATSK